MSRILKDQNENHPCKCDCCDGAGECSNHLKDECPCCDGDGECTYSSDCGGEIELQCEQCNGTGRIDKHSWEKDTCEECDGEGIIHSFKNGLFLQKSFNDRIVYNVLYCRLCKFTKYERSGKMVRPIFA